MRIIMDATKEDGTRYLSEPMELTIPEYVALQRRLGLEGYVFLNATRLDMVCDFCSAPGIRWRFEIEPGTVMGTIYAESENSSFSTTHVDEDGKWGACEMCANCIVAEDWDTLTNRALSHFPNYMRPIMEAAIVSGPHSAFRAGYEKTHPAPIPVISDEELMGHD